MGEREAGCACSLRGVERWDGEGSCAAHSGGVWRVVSFGGTVAIGGQERILHI